MKSAKAPRLKVLSIEKTTESPTAKTNPKRAHPKILGSKSKAFLKFALRSHRINATNNAT